MPSGNYEPQDFLFIIFLILHWPFLTRRLSHLKKSAIHTAATWASGWPGCLSGKAFRPGPCHTNPSGQGRAGQGSTARPAPRAGGACRQLLLGAGVTPAVWPHENTFMNTVDCLYENNNVAQGTKWKESLSTGRCVLWRNPPGDLSNAAWRQGSQHLKWCRFYSLHLSCLIKADILLNHLLLVLFIEILTEACTISLSLSPTPVQNKNWPPGIPLFVQQCSLLMQQQDKPLLLPCDY